MTRSNLRLEALEGREVPAVLAPVQHNYIPGYAGPEQLRYGDFNNDNFADRVVVAASGGGGSVRVMVFGNPHNPESPGYYGGEFNAEAAWPVWLDTIVFDPNFRGGGNILVVPYSTSGTDHAKLDKLLVTPGVGGGPVVAQFTFNAVTGQLTESLSFFAPYAQEFRGGLKGAIADVDGDGYYEAVFLPGEGGAPRLTAVDMVTYETELSVWVGDPEDYSGATAFEPGGATISVFRDGRWQDVFWIQRGETVDSYVEESEFWTFGGISID